MTRGMWDQELVRLSPFVFSRHLRIPTIYVFPPFTYSHHLRIPVKGSLSHYNDNSLVFKSKNLGIKNLNVFDCVTFTYFAYENNKSFQSFVPRSFNNYREPPWVTVLYILDHPININRWLSNATPLKLNDRGFDDPKLGFDTDYS